MLVCRGSLSLFVVALSLNALCVVVTSAKKEGAVATPSSDSGGSDPRATKRRSDSNGNPFQGNQFPSNRSENSKMPKKTAKGSASLETGYRKNSSSSYNTTSADSLSWNEGGDTSNSYKKQGNADNMDNIENTKNSPFWSEDIQVGCRELRARSYITDGYCTSEKPVQEVVCAGNCLPIMDMPWYAEFVKTVAKSKLKDWQCVEDVVRRKRVKLLCKNGSSRHYRIKVVKSCKCKKITNKHNKTVQKKKRRKSHKETSIIGS